MYVLPSLLCVVVFVWFMISQRKYHHKGIVSARLQFIVSCSKYCIIFSIVLFVSIIFPTQLAASRGLDTDSPPITVADTPRQGSFRPIGRTVALDCCLCSAFLFIYEFIYSCFFLLSTMRRLKVDTLLQ